MKRMYFLGSCIAFMFVCFVSYVMAASNSIHYETSELSIDGEIDVTFELKPSTFSRGGLYMSPERDEACFYTLGLFSICKPMGSNKSRLYYKKDLTGYIQLIKKDNPDFLRMSWLIREDENDVLISYYEKKKMNENGMSFTFNQFIIDLDSNIIKKFNGGENSSLSSYTTLFQTFGDYLIESSFEKILCGFTHIYTNYYSINNYKLGVGYYSVAGTGITLDPEAMTVTYIPYHDNSCDGDEPQGDEPQGDKIRGDKAITESFNSDIACIYNDALKIYECKEISERKELYPNINCFFDKPTGLNVCIK